MPQNQSVLPLPVAAAKQKWEFEADRGSVDRHEKRPWFFSSMSGIGKYGSETQCRRERAVCWGHVEHNIFDLLTINNRPERSLLAVFAHRLDNGAFKIALCGNVNHHRPALGGCQACAK
jgi:hypothetical protein